MAVPQPGIFAQGTRSHYHLEFDLEAGVTDEQIRAALTGLREPPVTAGGSNIVVGFGATLWRWLEPDAAPEALQPFEPIEGDGRRAPATQHDIWVWTHGTGEDIELDVARGVTMALAPVAQLAAEQPCFVYRDSRDLTGFIDGTENPPVEAAHDVAIVPDLEKGAGGSFVLAQKWVHDLGKFHAQSEEDQEATIGRTKPDSIELENKPPTAHISRVVIEEDGEELELYRRSTPYGRVGELGLYFLAFSADPSRFTKMMSRMFGTSGDGMHDHLTDFTHPVSGSFYFAPSLDDLDGILPSD
ncbi:MAG: Dyp-type peroxidase [Acidimicrobiia bacterium]